MPLVMLVSVGGDGPIVLRSVLGGISVAQPRYRQRTNGADVSKWITSVLLTMTVSICTCATLVAAQEAVDDSDADGVVDSADECPDTPAGTLIDERGCSVCPCETTAAGAAWASRREYIACVKAEAKRQRAAGLLRKKEMRAAIRAARRSTCADQQLTRCCVYADIDTDVGQCRLMTAEACDALDDRLFESDGAADDEGGGSCLPNPCVF